MEYASESAIPVPAEEKEENLSKDDSGECVVCMDNTVKTICLPCSHLCLCVGCSRKIGMSPDPVCPICRTGLTGINRVYSASNSSKRKDHPTVEPGDHPCEEPVIKPSLVTNLDEALKKLTLDDDIRELWINKNKESLISIWNGEDCTFDDEYLWNSYFSAWLAALLVAKGKTVIHLSYAVTMALKAQNFTRALLKIDYGIEIPRYDESKIRCGVPFGVDLKDPCPYEVVIVHGVFADFVKEEGNPIQLIKFTKDGKGSDYIMTGTGSCYCPCD